MGLVSKVHISLQNQSASAKTGVIPFHYASCLMFIHADVWWKNPFESFNWSPFLEPFCDFFSVL
jgi:hypothetical protein